MAEPIAVIVRRYRCPFCPRSLSGKTAMVAHIGRCWYNPATRSCKTCRHFEPINCCGMPDVYECYTPMCPTGPTCARGVDVGGTGERAGPVVNCELWDRKEGDE